MNSSSSSTSVIPNASKSFADISSKAIFFDAFLMAGGYLIMFAYTILMLGKLNRLQVLAINFFVEEEIREGFQEQAFPKSWHCHKGVGVSRLPCYVCF